ncbi:hypothetical protein C7T94_18360 [Pedobacter yulinensis]|uniref:RagB/SusD family nutrient uptake outer membrane protein n=1 Tax=Pedobacter yulinensis TaxID=2126353 RepID=A0A2T3HHH7_9SPHI|nr:RagB/SusD family nutrient uptake outer membrane protein [Pedobacter yulinensis]PST81853.1 hypothetical protein C7T94_18360 [Pedobacter yulinensis]
MKTIIKSTLLFSMLALASCEKGLDPELPGTINSENFYKTRQDLEVATTTIYHELRLGGWAPYMFSDGSSFVMDEVATGEWTTTWAWTNFLNGNWNVNDAMAIQFYNWLNPAVTRATYALARMEQSPVEPAARNGYMAQVRALRAFFVYDMWRLYGPLPLIVEGEKALYPDPDYKPARPSGQQVEAFIVNELKNAADNLPVEQAEYGRVTKGAALHYLLKFYMHKKDWQNALNTANQIIGLGYYSLQSTYESVFSAQNEKNKELIFVVVSEPLEGFGSHSFVNILPGDFRSPSGNALDGWNGHRMPWAFYDSFNSQDKRRRLALAEYTNKAGQTVNLRTNGDIGALPLKYGIDPRAFGIWSGNDKVLDRYAEVLLFKAEALNELNGPNAASIGLINDVRRRAFDNYSGSANELQLAGFPSKESLRDHLLKERGWEFWYEGKRREDLIRMGKYLEVGKRNATNFSETNLLFPIPRARIVENPNLVQNPGYN